MQFMDVQLLLLTYKHSLIPRLPRSGTQTQL